MAPLLPHTFGKQDLAGWVKELIKIEFFGADLETFLDCTLLNWVLLIRVHFGKGCYV